MPLRKSISTSQQVDRT